MPLVYRLSFSGFCYSCSFLFVVFVCLFVFFALIGAWYDRCSSYLFLSSRPRTGLATTYILLGMVEARSVNVKKKQHVPSLSGHAIAHRWRSQPRVHRHGASKPQGSSERSLPWQVTMDQLIFAPLSHTHYWFEVGMLLKYRSTSIAY